jgi:hypothetical protein
MKSIFFDTGPIISLVMSRLVWILPKLKEQYGGTFYITPAVKLELVDRPLTVKRFQFEALQVAKLIKDGVLTVYTEVPQKKVKELQTLANSAFSIKNKKMDIIQEGELQAVVTALQVKADAVVIDERTLRLYIENYPEMEKLLERRSRKDVVADIKLMKQFSDMLEGIKIIRSIELVGAAFKMGLLDSYIPEQKGGKKLLLNSILWATKYNGCAVTEYEIEEVKKSLLK